MTREEKIEAIYEEMANKELNLGCRVRFDKGIYTIIDKKNVGFLDSYRGEDGSIHNTIVVEDGVNSRCYSIEEIIGHPVMISDVLNYCSCYISDGDESVNSQLDLLSYRGDYRQPIENQPDECIDFVFNLIE